MRIALVLAALTALSISVSTQAVEVPSQADHDALSGRVDSLEQQIPAILNRLDALEALHAQSPVDEPPTVANLTTSCDENAHCSGDIGAADDNGSFTVNWGAGPIAGNPDGSWSWQTVDGDGLAVYHIAGEVLDGVNRPELFTLQVTVNDSVMQVGDLPSVMAGGTLQDCVAQLDTQGGGWCEMAVEGPDPSISSVWPPAGSVPGQGQPANILHAWNGAAFDPVRNLLYFHGGGHADYGGNEVYEFDLNSGTWTRLTDPSPLDHMTVHTASIPRYCWVPDLANVPGSTHTYDGLQYSTATGTIIHTRAYWAQGHCFDDTEGTIQPDDPRLITEPLADRGLYEFNPSRTEARNGLAPLTWRRLLDTGTIDMRLPRSVELPDGSLVVGSNTKLYEFDPATATLGDRVQYLGSQGDGPAVHHDGKIFSLLNSLQVFDLATGDNSNIPGPPGHDKALAVDSLGRLVVWDGLGRIWAMDYAGGERDWTLTAWGDDGPQVRGGQGIYSKWQYVPSHDVFVGLTTHRTGVWVYRHPWDAQTGGNEPPPDAPTFAGHTVAPTLVDLPAWNEPIQLQPEMPSLADRCPGTWNEVTYNSATEAPSFLGGGPNLRVYLHPDPNGYDLDARYLDCVEVVGLTDSEGNKPLMSDKMRGAASATLLRHVDFVPRTFPNASGLVVLHDVHLPKINTAWGSWRPDKPLRHLEIVNSVIGPCIDWHCMYLERSHGNFVALGSVFYGSGPSHHALKNLAHRSRLEGNVFSNVKLDGQIIGVHKNGYDILGYYALDLYGCAESIIRNNIFILRASGNIQTMHSYRARKAWSGCDKGQRLPDGSWEMFSPTSTEYQDAGTWANIQQAMAGLDTFQDAWDEPWAFAHLSEGNTFIYFTDGSGLAVPARIDTLRPISNVAVLAELQDEVNTLAGLYPNNPEAWRANASDRMLYVLDHLSEGLQREVMEAHLPHSVPTPHPEGWVPRDRYFWDENQTYITCRLDGTDCAEVQAPKPSFNYRDGDDFAASHLPLVVPPN